MSTPVLVQTIDGEARVSSEIIAERTEVQHKNVLGMIRDNRAEFEAFGPIAFETRKSGGRPTEVAHLNEPQATLLMTFMRNSDVVKAFKIELVRQFYAMRQALAGPIVPRNYAEALRAHADEVERAAALEAKIEADAPKVLFADSVAASKSTILVGDLAKILKANGVQVGANRLFERLREDGYLIRRQGSDWNMPTQRSMELGLFQIKETAVTHSDGHVTVNKTPKVTGKGQAYFINRYAPKRELVPA